MNKLISMEDYVLEQSDLWSCEQRLHRLEQYAQLLKSKPTLSMFIPCDDDGNVLVKPKHNEQDTWLWTAYQTALDKVIFDGWSVDYANEGFVSLVHLSYDIVFFKSGMIRFLDYQITYISDLTPYNLPLKNKL